MTGVLVDRFGAPVIVPAVAFLLVTAGVPLLAAADAGGPILRDPG